MSELGQGALGEREHGDSGREEGTQGSQSREGDMEVGGRGDGAGGVKDSKDKGGGMGIGTRLGTRGQGGDRADANAGTHTPGSCRR